METTEKPKTWKFNMPSTEDLDRAHLDASCYQGGKTGQAFGIYEEAVAALKERLHDAGLKMETMQLDRAAIIAERNSLKIDLDSSVIGLGKSRVENWPGFELSSSRPSTRTSGSRSSRRPSEHHPAQGLRPRSPQGLHRSG